MIKKNGAVYRQELENAIQLVEHFGWDDAEKHGKMSSW